MALTTPKMVLKVWNLLTDPYDHDQLADNWAKVDQHDHTSSRGVQIPTEGIFDGAITSAKLATGLDPAPGYTVYKPLRQAGGPITAPATGTLWLLAKTEVAAGSVPVASGAYAFYVDPADFAVPGRTTYFRLRLVVVTNAVAPVQTITAGVSPIAGWGGASGAAATINSTGAQTAGSTVAITNPPAASSTGPALGSDFTLLAGWYALSILITTTGTAGSVITPWVGLDYRTV
jgi:hypothetical protein